ncbi:MAG: PPC domain-containing protein [Deltaproteobacteria bacterium]|nr:PPC domain-containing protein [Deltaproteobacteria bacterium]
MRLAPIVLLFCFAFACGEDPPAPAKECTRTADCGDGRVCAADGTCIANAECGTDLDCEPRRACDAATHACHPRPGFGDDCDATRPCPFGQFCSTLLGLCLESSASRDCTRRSECPAQQICDREATKCVVVNGCYGDDFCEAGEVCDLIAKTCRAAATACVPCQRGSCMTGSCLTDSTECVLEGARASCREGERCDPLGRCVQCTRTADCGPGLYCNAALGRCESDVVCAATAAECPTSPDVSCVTCASPQTCDARTRRCIAPPTECETDVDCVGDEYCDLTADPPVCTTRLPACIDDRFGEPNDDPSRAALLAEDYVPDLRACPETEDWYAVSAAAGTHLTIDVRFDEIDGDLDVQLFLPDATTLVAQSRSTNDNERVEVDAGTDVRFLLRVFFATRAPKAVPYALLVGRQSGPVCEDDGHEPDDLLPEARVIETDRPFAGVLCSGDPDWFVARGIPEGTHLRATLEHRRSLGDLDLELYRASSRVPILIARSLSDLEAIDYDASFAGDYYFRVVGRAADANAYSLRLEVRPSGSGCLDDRFEPNDEPAAAVLSPEDTTPVALELSICRGDEDWYLVNLGPDETLRAEIGFSAGGDLELALYAPGTSAQEDAPLVISDGVGVRETLAYRAVAPGDYLLRVYSPRDEGASAYELRVNRDPPFFCEPDEDDLAERGGSSATAVDLGLAPARVDGVTFCEGDTDWYRVRLPAGFMNLIRLAFVPDDATLQIKIYDLVGNQLFASAGTTGSFREVGLRAVGFPGQFIEVALEVAGTPDSTTPYSLAVDLAPIYSCSPDLLEVNDVPVVATVLETFPYEDEQLTLCVSAPSSFGPGDEDWYSVSAERGRQITASIEFSFGDLRLELYSPGAARRACENVEPVRCFSDGPGHTEAITFTATTADPYLLRVSSIYGLAGSIAPFSIDTPYRLRVDLEP